MNRDVLKDLIREQLDLVIGENLIDEVYRDKSKLYGEDWKVSIINDKTKILYHEFSTKSGEYFLQITEVVNKDESILADVVFKLKSRLEPVTTLSKTGSSNTVFQIVYNLVSEYIEKYKPEYVFFYGDSAEGRDTLYKKIATKLGNDQGYGFYNQENLSTGEFLLKKKV